jgi:superfamily II DNA or RNA helicase
MKVELRPYQSDSIESLRDGFKNGHKRQVLAASTGAGKSIISLSILDAAREKGSKVMFQVRLEMPLNSLNRPPVLMVLHFRESRVGV